MKLSTLFFTVHFFDLVFCKNVWEIDLVFAHTFVTKLLRTWELESMLSFRSVERSRHVKKMKLFKKLSRKNVWEMDLVFGKMYGPGHFSPSSSGPGSWIPGSLFTFRGVLDRF